MDARRPGAVFIFVDDLHFEPEYTPHVRRMIEDLADNLLHDGDLVAMVSSGPSTIEIGLTYDREAGRRVGVEDPRQRP